MKIKTIIALSLLSTVPFSPAYAADVVSSFEPTPVAAPFSWAGGYLGGQVGYGWANPKNSVSSSPFVDEDGESIPGVQATITPKSKGFLGGVYGGYNFDMGGNAILGLEADAVYTRMKGNQTVTNDYGTAKFSETLDWSGSVRARAGYAVDRFLPFVTGGVAFGLVNQSTKATLVEPEEDFDGKYSQKSWRAGYTLGAGVDYAATDNVILRVEYRFTDFGKRTESLDFGNAKETNRLRTNEIRMGIAYKF